MMVPAAAAFYYLNGQLIAHAAGSMPTPRQLASPIAGPAIVPSPYGPMPAGFQGLPGQQVAPAEGPATWKQRHQQMRWQHQWQLR